MSRNHVNVEHQPPELKAILLRSRRTNHNRNDSKKKSCSNCRSEFHLVNGRESSIVPTKNKKLVRQSTAPELSKNPMYPYGVRRYVK